MRCAVQSGLDLAPGRGGRGDVHIDDLLDHLTLARSRKSAFGCDTEIIEIFPRHVDTAARSLGAILGMHEAEIELGASCKLELLQGAIEVVVDACNRDRNMEIRDRM